MAEQEQRNVLSIRGMCKSFGRNRVLDHIDLDQQAEQFGDVTGIGKADAFHEGPSFFFAQYSTDWPCLPKKMHAGSIFLW